MLRLVSASIPRFSRVCRLSLASPSASENLTITRARLLYQSKKRGILENDILLGDFADQNLGKMDKSLLDAYDKLINGEHMEWDLFYYLSGKKTPPDDVANCKAFQMLRQFVLSKQS